MELLQPLSPSPWRWENYLLDLKLRVGVQWGNSRKVTCICCKHASSGSWGNSQNRGGRWVGCNSTPMDGGIRTWERGWSGPCRSFSSGQPGREGLTRQGQLWRGLAENQDVGGGGGSLLKGPAAAGPVGSLRGPGQAHKVAMCESIQDLLAVEPAHDGTGSAMRHSPCPHTVPCPTPGCKEMSTRASLASPPLGGSRSVRPWGDRQGAGVLFLTKDGSVDSSGETDLLLLSTSLRVLAGRRSFAS